MANTQRYSPKPLWRHARVQHERRIQISPLLQIKNNHSGTRDFNSSDLPHLHIQIHDH